MDIDLLTRPDPPSRSQWVIVFIVSVLIIFIIYHSKKSAPSLEAPAPKPSTASSTQPMHLPALAIQWAAHGKISADFEDRPIADVLHQIAQFIDLNMVISPAVRGRASLHWQSVEPKSALASLIHSQRLSHWEAGGIWFVTTHAEFMQRQEEELRLKKILEDTAPVATRLWQIHYAKADDLADIIQDTHHSLLSRRGQIRVDSRTNILCIREQISRFQELDALIRRLDVPVRQIRIEALLASVDSDFEQALGVQFHLGKNSAALSPGPYSLAAVKLADGSLLNVQLAALEKEGHAELISSPSLLTANLQTAFIESGEEIPYQETSANGATSVTFKKAVLSLKITPHLLPDDQILLQLQVNQDKPSAHIILGVPAINTRQIKTQVLVKAGQTIVLGGIFETNSEQVEQRIPFLGTIPWAGKLFSQNNEMLRKRELLVFVTPKIKW